MQPGPSASAELRRERSRSRVLGRQVVSLLQRCEDIRQDERRRVARDIHDHVGQLVTALRIHLEVLQGLGGSNQALLAQIAQARSLAEALDRGLDDVIAQCHPVTHPRPDFAVALSTLVAEWSERFGIAAHCAVARDAAGQLPMDTGATLLAITSEALHNVIKHAGAGSVTVSFSCGDGRAVLLIEDDGRGFALSQDAAFEGGIGLVTMRERAELAGGELVIVPSLTGGTTVSVRLPLADRVEPGWHGPAPVHSLTSRGSSAHSSPPLRPSE